MSSPPISTHHEDDHKYSMESSSGAGYTRPTLQKCLLSPSYKHPLSSSALASAMDTSPNEEDTTLFTPIIINGNHHMEDVKSTSRSPQHTPSQDEQTSSHVDIPDVSPTVSPRLSQRDVTLSSSPLDDTHQSSPTGPSSLSSVSSVSSSRLIMSNAELIKEFTSIPNCLKLIGTDRQFMVNQVILQQFNLYQLLSPIILLLPSNQHFAHNCQLGSIFTCHEPPLIFHRQRYRLRDIKYLAQMMGCNYHKYHALSKLYALTLSYNLHDDDDDNDDGDGGDKQQHGVAIGNNNKDNNTHINPLESSSAVLDTLWDKSTIHHHHPTASNVDDIIMINNHELLRAVHLYIKDTLDTFHTSQKGLVDMICAIFNHKAPQTVILQRDPTTSTATATTMRSSLGGLGLYRRRQSKDKIPARGGWPILTAEDIAGAVDSTQPHNGPSHRRFSGSHMIVPPHHMSLTSTGTTLPPTRDDNTEHSSHTSSPPPSSSLQSTFHKQLMYDSFMR